ncbi:hypothetical protein F5141DRAFT_1067845 [Pisolithus sp. B1]|nr:hypothetical protein F5141DRAFT_1067845 [Pisolithus sp. B1]
MYSVVMHVSPVRREEIAIEFKPILLPYQESTNLNISSPSWKWSVQRYHTQQWCHCVPIIHRSFCGPERVRQVTTTIPPWEGSPNPQTLLFNNVPMPYPAVQSHSPSWTCTTKDGPGIGKFFKVPTTPISCE